MHWPSVFQFVIGTLAAVSFFTLSIGTLLTGFAQFADGATLGNVDALPFISSAALLSLGFLALPSGIFGFARIIRRPLHPRLKISWYTLRIAIWLAPPVIGLGFLVSRVPEAAWFVLPPLHVLATGLPLLWYLSLGARRLKDQLPQRSWGAFGAGMGLSLIPIFALEIFFLLVILIVIAVILSGEPGFMRDLEALADRLAPGSQPDIDILLPFLEKYFLDVRIVALGGLYVAVLVPFIEEAFKPIGMIFLNRRALTPEDGFYVGMLSGAGFAFIESVLQAAGGEEWWSVVSGRIGTGLIHITNSGLVGMGIALAIRERAYLKMMGYYLLAVLIHGLWNGLAVVSFLGYTPEFEIRGLDGSAWETIGLISPGLLVLVGLGTMLILVRLNRQFRKDTGPPAGP